MRGLYLASPHGRLIYDGLKHEIITARPASIEGDRIVCSTEDKMGLAFGRATIGSPSLLDLDSFDERFESHHVTRASRKKWWPDADHLYSYPILYFATFQSPIPIEISPGTTMDMGLIPDSILDTATKLDTITKVATKDNLAVTPSSDTIATTEATVMSSSFSDDFSRDDEGEKAMPWTTDSPPKPAKNWTDDEKKKCVAAANAALKDDPDDEQGAIFACIRAAGKTKYPGGKKAISLDSQRNIIHEAFRAEFPYPSPAIPMQPSEAWVKEVWDEFVIVESGANIYKVSYTFSDDEIAFAPCEEWQQVEQVWNEIGEKAIWSIVKSIEARGEGRGVGGEPQGDGGASVCVCPKCGHKTPHEKGTPCSELKCPKCDATMGGTTSKTESKGDSIVAQKAGDEGDSDPGTCTCPNCGAKSDKEADASCSEQKCPKCNAKMRGGEAESEKIIGESGSGTNDDANPGDSKEHGIHERVQEALDAMDDARLADTLTALEATLEATQPVHAPSLETTISVIKGEQVARLASTPTDAITTTGEPTSKKSGRRINSSIMSKLRSIKDSFERLLGEVIGFGDYADLTPPETPEVEIKSSFKVYEGEDGQDWFEIWPTNAYKDRDGEFFTSKALEDFVIRNESKETKGELWFHHIPGSEFGMIKAQAVVADHFLVQLGTFDDTPIARSFKAFFAKYPHSHPTIAPNGWGASHGYNYIHQDRIADGIYNWFDIKESSVLPVKLAANPYNPRPEVFVMNDKQKAEIEAIGSEVGVDLLAQIQATAATRKVELDEGKVERKSTDADKTNKTEQVPDDSKDKDESQLVQSIVSKVVEQLAAKVVPPEAEKSESEPESTDPNESPSENEVKSVALQVAEELQLDELSKALSSIVAQQKVFETTLASIQSTLSEVKKADEVKLAQKVAAAPRLSWFRASQAAESVLGERDGDLKAAHPAVPDAVNFIANRLSGGA